MPHSSWRRSAQARPEIESTSSRAGWPAASIAFLTAAMSESAPVEVSLWTTQTALIFFSPSLRRRASICSGWTPRRQCGASGQQRVAAGRDQDLGRQAEARRHLLPERREVAGLDHQHGVAGAQRVDQRRLPRAGARRRVDDDRMARLEDLADVGQDLPAERAELGPAVVDRRQAHRPQDAIGDRARAGDLEEVAAGRVEVEVEHDRVSWRPHSCTRPRARRSAFVLAGASVAGAGECKNRPRMKPRC